jgi:hypothetical protein
MFLPLRLQASTRVVEQHSSRGGLATTTEGEDEDARKMEKCGDQDQEKHSVDNIYRLNNTEQQNSADATMDDGGKVFLFSAMEKDGSEPLHLKIYPRRKPLRGLTMAQLAELSDKCAAWFPVASIPDTLRKFEPRGMREVATFAVTVHNFAGFVHVARALEKVLPRNACIWLAALDEVGVSNTHCTSNTFAVDADDEAGIGVALVA